MLGFKCIGEFVLYWHLQDQHQEGGMLAASNDGAPMTKQNVSGHERTGFQFVTMHTFASGFSTER
jgi:hypothetical protein